MAAAGDATTSPISRASHLLANSSFSPRLVSLNVEVNRTLEPALGKIDAVCDNMCHFSKILSDLQKQQELIQQQIEEKETEVKASDIVDIRRRQAALEQRVLNLQIHFQDFIDSHTQLQALCQQQQTRIDELYTQVSQVLANTVTTPPTISLVTDLPWLTQDSKTIVWTWRLFIQSSEKEHRPSTVVAGAKLRTPLVSIWCLFTFHHVGLSPWFSMTQLSSRLFPQLWHDSSLWQPLKMDLHPDSTDLNMSTLPSQSTLLAFYLMDYPNAAMTMWSSTGNRFTSCQSPQPHNWNYWRWTSWKKPSRSSVGNASRSAFWRGTSRCGFKLLHTTPQNFPMEVLALSTMTWPGKKSLTITGSHMITDTSTFELSLPTTHKIDQDDDLNLVQLHELLLLSDLSTFQTHCSKEKKNSVRASI